MWQGNLQWNADGSVRSLNNQSVPPTLLTEGQLATFDLSKFQLAVYSGRVIGDDICRFALGDSNSLVFNPGYGWGLSDGFSDVYASGSSAFHSLLNNPGGSSQASLPLLSADMDFTAVDIINDQLTVSTTGWFTGNRVRYDVGTALIGGLTGGTHYFVIVVNATTMKLATTRANAMAGVAIDLTSQGLGTHQFRRMSGLSSYDGENVTVYAISHAGANLEYGCLTDADLQQIFTTTGGAAISGSFTPSPAMRFSGIDLFAAAFYEFSALPADYIAGIKWHGAAWKLPNNRGKFLYAPWVNLG